MIWPFVIPFLQCFAQRKALPFTQSYNKNLPSEIRRSPSLCGAKPGQSSVKKKDPARRLLLHSSQPPPCWPFTIPEGQGSLSRAVTPPRCILWGLCPAQCLPDSCSSCRKGSQQVAPEGGCLPLLFSPVLSSACEKIGLGGQQWLQE